MKKRLMFLVIVVMFGLFLASCADEAVEFTISFDTNGGSEIADIVIEDGTAINLPENPTRDGYTFVGWYVDEALASAFAAGTIPTGDITLYAKWEAVVVSYTVQFDTDGGSFIANTSVEAGSQVTEPADPTKSGFAFVGWYTDQALTTAYDFSSAVNANLVLYAKWMVPLTSITFSGIADGEVEYGSVFDVFEGVTAIGNDGVDYTDIMTVTSLTVTDGLLDTTKVQEHGLRYEVRIGTEFLQQQWRYITVLPPERPDTFVVNGTFDEGTAFWDDSANGLYIADGAALTITHDETEGEGSLKAEVVAGSNLYTPRFGQQGIPFEQGKTYEVSFKAKSTVEKTINVQVGELISYAPWFVDFKTGQTEHHTITTEWQTFSFKFTMGLDNPRGGILFELGTLGGVAVDATIWFDDINAEESIPDVDTKAPTFSGIVETINIPVDSMFDPLAGVTAFDLTDGDVTDQIIVSYEDALGNPIVNFDTSVVGSFKVIYTVSDSLGNEGTAETIVNVVSLLFKDTNLVANPSFAAQLNVDTPEWALWSQDWGAAPVVDFAHDLENGKLNVDITGGGDAAWAVQVFQDGYLTLVEGQTYRLAFTVDAEVARSVNVTLGYSYGDNQYADYARKNGIQLAQGEGTYEFIFTVNQPTHAVKLVFELGSQDGFADGLLSFSEVELNELDAEPIIENSAFDLIGWRYFFNDWEGTTGSSAVVDGEFVLTLNNYALGGANWKLQLIQDEVALGISGVDNGVLVFEPNTTYTLSFDAYASEAITIVPLVATPGVWANFVVDATATLTDVKTTYTFTLTTPETIVGTEVFKFEFGNGLAPFEAVDGPVTIAFDNLMIKDAGENALTSVYNGDFETVLGHMYDNAGEGVGSMVLGADGAVIVVETLGSQPYTPHYYIMIDELMAGDYTVTFRITSSVSRDLRFNMVLPNAGWGSILPDGSADFAVVAEELYTFTLNFTLEATTTDIKVELDFGTLPGELVSLPGTFVIHEIIVYPVYS